MSIRKLLFVPVFVVCTFFSTNAQVNVDVNFNMKHSVDDVSNFGRDRRMTIHSSLTEGDWTDHEDKLDYLMNDLDVYFGRETGSATWKNQGVEEDPNNPGWPNEAQMIEHGAGLKDWYESEYFTDRHQYEVRSKNMIMGINDFSPAYPNLSWFPTFGKGVGGWFVKDTDAAAEWIGAYLDHYLASEEGAFGEPMPKYWEAYNEPDMNFMNTEFGMIVSSLEKNWEYHKLVAAEVRERLGDNAPLIGGMTWGQLDLFKPDGIHRTDGSYWYEKSSTEAGLWYDNMLTGVGESGGVAHPGIGLDVWPKAWDNKTKDWWQWDYMYQGFIDYCGADMDFYGVHMYDWPQESDINNKANTRAGGHIEAYLDMFEWYDNHLFGDKKNIVLSEFGAVNRDYILSLPRGERDWPFIRAFNQMQMQFLERPSHVVYSMPFAPTKAEWGAYFDNVQYDADGNITNTYSTITRYEGATLMDPVGLWDGNPKAGEMNEPEGGWEWSTIIHFFELWKDVEGTRIDTKSENIDVQVDAYVLGNHAYLILNNSVDDSKTININNHGLGSNTISNVELRHLYLGSDNIPKYTVADMTSVPTQVTLNPNSTIVLDYTFSTTVTVDQESKEIKYMCDPLASGEKNDRGTQKCHTASKASITATVNDVKKPEKGEAVIRVGGFFTNPTDGVLADGSYGLKVRKLTVNGNPVIVDSDNFVANTRGYGIGNYKGSWFGVLELDCPAEYLKDGENTVYFERWQGVEFTTIMIQAFDMTTEPGRTNDANVALSSISLGGDEDVMEGRTLGLVPNFTPANASNKGLTWLSSDTNVATVDENGVVIAVSSTGSATITATSIEDGTIKATQKINAIKYTTGTVSSISIVEGDNIVVDQFTNTPLSIQFTPAVDELPTIIWESNDESVVEVSSTGKLYGKKINGTATITATVEGTSITDQIEVSVRIQGEEQAYTNMLPGELSPELEYNFDVSAHVMGSRTILLELLKGNTVLDSETQSVSAVGFDTANFTLNLTEKPDYGEGYSYRVTLKEGMVVLKVRTKNIVMRPPTPVEEILITKQKISLFTGKTKELSAIVYPAEAGDKTITWTSSSDAIAKVNSLGVVTGVKEGVAIITATSNDGTNKIATCEVNVVYLDPSATKIVVEAEDFTSTGGTIDDGTWGGPGLGMNRTADGVNYVNGGDWIEIPFTVSEAGKYFASAFTATPESGKEIVIKIGSQTVSVGLPTTDWDTYVEIDVPGTFDLEAGSHTMRIETGDNEDWQFNIDKIVLTEGEGLEPDVDNGPTVVIVDGDISNEIMLYPNPVADQFNIYVPEVAEYIVLNSMGQICLLGSLNEGESMIVTNSLTSGIYFIRLMVNDQVVIKRFVKN